MKQNILWYAVMRDELDDDWGTGSFDLREALLMVLECGTNAYIAVIDVNAGICVDELRFTKTEYHNYLEEIS